MAHSWCPKKYESALEIWRWYMTSRKELERYGTSSGPIGGLPCWSSLLALRFGHDFEWAFGCVSAVKELLKT